MHSSASLRASSGRPSLSLVAARLLHSASCDGSSAMAEVYDSSLSENLPWANCSFPLASRAVAWVFDEGAK
jgi:hypothetical protein